jgi:hypothetical protein
VKVFDLNGPVAIQNDDNHQLWESFTPMSEYDNNFEAPKLKWLLVEWLNDHAAGLWTTIWHQTIATLVVRDPKLAMLFKLTFSGDSQLEPVRHSLTHFYCPYIPLTVSGTGQAVDLRKIHDSGYSSPTEDPEG